MPRTKRPRKVRASIGDNNEVELKLEDFGKKCHMQLKNIEEEFDRMIMQMESDIDASLNRLPKEIRNMTFGELLSNDFKDEIDSKEYNDENKSEIISSQVTMKQNVRKHASRFDSKSIKSKKPSRSSSCVNCGEIKSRPVKTERSTSTASVSKRPHRSNSNNRDRHHPTPAKNRTPLKNFFVTPKVNLRTPVNILRRPREGEMALSLDGSPLYVSALAPERMANMNVPLHNGNILSFLPRDDLRMSHLPDLDSETLRQLRTLKKHIEKVIDRD